MQGYLKRKHNKHFEFCTGNCFEGGYTVTTGYNGYNGYILVARADTTDVTQNLVFIDTHQTTTQFTCS